MPWQRAAAKPDAEPPDAAQLRDAAVRLLAQREHSSYQLEQKLKRKFGAGLDSAVLAEVLRELAADGLQSDERFAEAKIRQRLRTGFGPLRLRGDLRQAGIDPALADGTLGAAAQDWGELAKAVAARKFGDDFAGGDNAARCARFLKSRGYPDQVVRELLLP